MFFNLTLLLLAFIVEISVVTSAPVADIELWSRDTVKSKRDLEHSYSIESGLLPSSRYPKQQIEHTNSQTGINDAVKRPNVKNPPSVQNTKFLGRRSPRPRTKQTQNLAHGRTKKPGAINSIKQGKQRAEASVRKVSTNIRTAGTSASRAGASGVRKVSTEIRKADGYIKKVIPGYRKARQVGSRLGQTVKSRIKKERKVNSVPRKAQQVKYDVVRPGEIKKIDLPQRIATDRGKQTSDTDQPALQEAVSQRTNSWESIDEPMDAPSGVKRFGTVQQNPPKRVTVPELERQRSHRVSVAKSDKSRITKASQRRQPDDKFRIRRPGANTMDGTNLGAAEYFLKSNPSVKNKKGTSNLNPQKFPARKPVPNRNTVKAPTNNNMDTNSMEKIPIWDPAQGKTITLKPTPEFEGNPTPASHKQPGFIPSKAKQEFTIYKGSIPPVEKSTHNRPSDFEKPETIPPVSKPVIGRLPFNNGG